MDVVGLVDFWRADDLFKLQPTYACESVVCDT